MQTLIINTDNTNYKKKEQNKNEPLPLYFDDILVAGRVSF